jgi:ADP-ribose pyrophosphatase YjhB (NUDIX family)
MGQKKKEKMGKKKRVRTLALCVITHEDKYLLGEGKDPKTKQRFYRPLGGSIEFGETASQAVIRELQEELGVELNEPKKLGFLENIFTYDGEPGHEIVIVFTATLRDTSLHQKASLPRLDMDGRAVWRTSAELKQNPLYPTGLLSLLAV